MSRDNKIHGNVQVNKVSIIKREIFSFNGSFPLLSLAISSAFLPLRSGEDNRDADSPMAIELRRQSRMIMNSIGRLFLRSFTFFEKNQKMSDGEDRNVLSCPNTISNFFPFKYVHKCKHSHCFAHRTESVFRGPHRHVCIQQSQKAESKRKKETEITKLKKSFIRNNKKKSRDSRVIC